MRPAGVRSTLQPRPYRGRTSRKTSSGNLLQKDFRPAKSRERLRVPRSRSAVLGRAYRLGVKVGHDHGRVGGVQVGLTMEESAIAREALAGIVKPREPIRPGPVTEAEAQLFLGSAAPVALVPIPTVGPGRPPIPLKQTGRSVYELTHSCCRWIDGEPSDPRPYKCTGGPSQLVMVRAHTSAPTLSIRPMRLQTRELA